MTKDARRLEARREWALARPIGQGQRLVAVEQSIVVILTRLGKAKS
ncbi:MAG: hypothetical protein IPI35_26385 [Deltaproteobacteria bacterium]|nr:hypothetical protein [Deltaproteobacteria bacterium]